MNSEMPHQARRESLEVGNVIYSKVQPELAMCHYKSMNNSAKVDIVHPFRNEKEVRDEAIELWNTSFSGLFEEYILDQPGLDVDLSSPADVADLYEDFKRWHEKRNETAGRIEIHGHGLN